MRLDLRDAGGDPELGRREEHREESAHHQVVDLLLGLRQGLRCLQRGNDGEVVGDLAVVEDALVARPHPVVVEHLAGEGPVGRTARQHGQGLAHRGRVVFRQCLGIGSRVGERLVLLVECLGQRQRGLGREAEAPIGLALKAGEVEERRGSLCGRTRLFGDGAWPALAIGHDGAGTRFIPEPLGAQIGVGRVAHEGRVEPAALVLARLRAEGGLDLEVGSRLEPANALLALDHDGQRGGLHAAHGGEIEAAVARVERGHGPRAVDAHQPVGLGAAARGIGQRHHLAVITQLAEGVADGCRGHGLQPQAAHRLARLGVLGDQPEDELALAPGVASVDQGVDVLAADEPGQQLEPLLVLGDGLDIEVRRDHRQVGEGPFAPLDLELLGCGDLHQMTDRR